MISTYMDKFFIIILIVLISKNTSFIILLTMEIQIQAGAIADQSDISHVIEVVDIFTFWMDIQ